MGSKRVSISTSVSVVFFSSLVRVLWVTEKYEMKRKEDDGENFLSLSSTR